MPETEFNWELYESLMAAYCSNLAALAADARDTTTNYVVILPPGMESMPFAPVQSQPPFDAKAFPTQFVSGLTSQQVGEITVYPLRAYTETNEYRSFFFNAATQSLGSVSAEGQYDSTPEEYAPTNLVLQYSLISEADLIKLAWLIPPSAGGEPWAEPGPPTGSVEHLCLSGIRRLTDSVQLLVAYPTGGTNDFRGYCTNVDLFACGRLDQSWWELAGTAWVNAATNWIAVTNAGTAAFQQHCYLAANGDLDSDGDGYANGRELYLYRTDPSDSNSWPAFVSGSVAYAGRQTGPLCIVAVTDSNSWSAGPCLTLPAPGSYTNLGVAAGTGYWFRAYRDSDGSMDRDWTEAQGTYPGSPVVVTSNLTDVSITLLDPDTDGDGLPDWWELECVGSLTNLTGSGDNDGDGFANSNEYAQLTNPLDGDTDDDGMGDWAEWVNGQNPTNWDSYSKLPFYESFDVLQYQKLTAAGATNFGYSVAVWSNALVVGAPDLNGVTNGAAYVFEWSGTNWGQPAKLTAWDGTATDCFGVAVAVHSDTAVVGADNAEGKGAAYTFQRSGTNWLTGVRLTGESSVGARFGCALAINGNRLVVGARGENATYVFDQTGTNWERRQLFIGSEDYGCAVGVSSNLVVVGADDTGWSGQAYVWEATGTTWICAPPLKPTSWPGGFLGADGFGNAVAISGQRIVVGASRYDKGFPGSADHGAAFIFTRSTEWGLPQRLVAENGARGDRFGKAVALCEGVVVVGADGRDSNGADSGLVYLFREQGSNWLESAILPAKDTAGLADAGDLLGSSVGAWGDHLVVGAPGDSNNCGAVYVFSLANALAAHWPTNDTPIHAQHGWIATPPSLVAASTNSPQEGTAALHVRDSFKPATAQRLVAAYGDSNVWVDSWCMFNPTNISPSLAHPDISDLPASIVSALAVDSSGHLLAYDGIIGNWRTASNVTVLATNYHRYTVMQDYGCRKWRVYFEGSNVLSELGFRSSNVTEFCRFAYAGKWRWNGSSHLDALAITTNRPGGLSE